MFERLIPRPPSDRALARTGARSVVVPPGLPENVVPDEPWFRLEDSRR
ncbi:hypothetical protein ACFU3E_23630 [Streptomyces sp. NPDC057424]